MRKLFSLVAALGLVMGAAQPAHATVQAITSAALSIAINPGGAIPVIVYTWNGLGTGNLDQSAGGSITSLTAGIFSFTGTIDSLPITDPGAAPMNGLQILAGSSNGVGNFGSISTVFGGGTMAATGSANICMYAPCSTPTLNVNVPFTQTGNGIGLGGAPIVVPGIPVALTVMGNGWTTGTATLGTMSFSGTPLYDGGHVKLVTPIVLMTNNSAFPVVPAFGFLDLDLVPEPGTLILLASGVAGLAMVGRKRMSK